MIKSLILSLALSIVGGQTNIPYRNTIDFPQKTGHFEQSILYSNRFHMNQSFSLSTSMNGNTNQTTGIYSNFTSYKLSKRMNVNAVLHLSQGQNNLVSSSGSQMGIGYELGLEYILNPNSIISLQIINYRNSPMLYRNFSSFNVP